MELAALRQAIGGRRLGVRGRLHAIWALARAGGPAVVGELLDLARAETDPRIQAQAVRAVADLADPVLVRHRLDAGPGDADLAERLAHLAQDRDPRVVREVVIAVGRLGWPAAPIWLHSILKDPDPALAHAAVQTMRRSANWPAILALLDQPDSVPRSGPGATGDRRPGPANGGGRPDPAPAGRAGPVTASRIRRRSDPRLQEAGPGALLGLPAGAAPGEHGLLGADRGDRRRRWTACWSTLIERSGWPC